MVKTKKGGNPPCNGLGCKNKKTVRCSIILSPETEQRDAEFVEDGVAYGYTYFYCKKCLKKQRERGRSLKVWND